MQSYPEGKYMCTRQIKKTVEQSASWAGGKPLQIPTGNLLLLRDHPEGHNKIWDNYKSELFIVEDIHKDPNIILCG